MHDDRAPAARVESWLEHRQREFQTHHFEIAAPGEIEKLKGRTRRHVSAADYGDLARFGRSQRQREVDGLQEERRRPRSANIKPIRASDDRTWLKVEFRAAGRRSTKGSLADGARARTLARC